MDLAAFIQSLSSDHHPEGISVLMKSLWYDAKGDWEKSHDLISEIETKEGAWIHAYLHRKEGDNWNADYWYRRAGVKRPGISLEKEWEQLVETFIRSHHSV